MSATEDLVEQLARARRSLAKWGVRREPRYLVVHRSQWDRIARRPPGGFDGSTRAPEERDRRPSIPSDFRGYLDGVPVYSAPPEGQRGLLW